MTQNASPPGIRVPAVVTPPDALKQGIVLVQELGKLAPLLSVEHKKLLVGKLVDAFTTGSGASRPRPASKPPEPKASAGPATRSATRAPSRVMRLCPHCNCSVRADRLERHVAKMHGEGGSRPPAQAARPSPTAPAGAQAGTTRRKRQQIVCGDCDRLMYRDEYATHDCRHARRGGFVVGGGAPGLGRKR